MLSSRTAIGTLNADQIRNAAQLLFDATRAGLERDRLSALYPDMNVADAYAIQREGRGMRESQGAKLLGWKMGLTSIAKRQQMNLDAAIFGYLHDAGLHPGGKLSMKGLIHPKIEPEIGFRLKKPLKGKVSFKEALAAIGSVCAALEVIDSRFRGFKYFSLPDVIADNGSASRYIWGEEVAAFEDLRLDELKMSMYALGQLQQEAYSSEISGHPVHSLMQLSELLHQNGEELAAGSLVLAGAATNAIPLEPGQRIELKIDSLPPLQVDISE